MANPIVVDSSETSQEESPESIRLAEIFVITDPVVRLEALSKEFMTYDPETDLATPNLPDNFTECFPTPLSDDGKEFLHFISLTPYPVVRELYTRMNLALSGPEGQDLEYTWSSIFSRLGDLLRVIVTKVSIDNKTGLSLVISVPEVGHKQSTEVLCPDLNNNDLKAFLVMYNFYSSLYRYNETVGKIKSARWDTIKQAGDSNTVRQRLIYVRDQARSRLIPVLGNNVGFAAELLGGRRFGPVTKFQSVKLRDIYETMFRYKLEEAANGTAKDSHEILSPAQR